VDFLVRFRNDDVGPWAGKLTDLSARTIDLKHFLFLAQSVPMSTDLRAKGLLLECCLTDALDGNIESRTATFYPLQTASSESGVELACLTRVNQHVQQQVRITRHR
jgi:hypothetical protein